ncbi:cob(I)yrinic acid a,c-diamide adenosyltransferase [bacterium D16-51]|nr:cob(I)yrinic acid a,c-diamide adenosyltransferase [bacterium D16-59]RKI58954.1 cob(I)yrinic acid a,c-diamide adenosyltransferase [bacterium D16-51]
MHLYYGDGKGKTTAAIGLAIRAAGTGKKVLFTQFMKGSRSGELEELQRIGNITVLRSQKQFPFYKDMTSGQKMEQAEIHNRMLDTILDGIRQGQYDLIVLDEITYPYQWELLDRQKFQKMAAVAKDTVELVCTGRDPASFFLEHADYISEMKCVRHPFEKGIRAREGIEF